MNRPIRVLLVEDSADDAALVLLELRHGGYRPVCERVENAAAMTAALDTSPWDVVIADYVLPRFSGPAALKLLQERGLDLPFIIVSGHVDENTAVASMKAGAHDYVMKGRLARLVPAIEREMHEAEVRRARRQSEVEFAREQNFRRAIEDSIPSGIAAMDLQGRHTYVNPAFCRLVGWTEAELLASGSPHAYWPPEEVANIRGAFDKLVLGRGSPEGFELRFRHRNGNYFDAFIQASPIRDSRGEVSGWLGSVTDITQRKLAEQRLRVQYDVASALSRATGVEAAIPVILATVGGTMGWEVGAFWRVREDGGEIWCVDTWRQSFAALEQFENAVRLKRYLPGEGLPGRVAATGEPIWDTNLPGDDTMESPRGYCAAPVRLRDQTLGVIGFFSRAIGRPDDTLLRWLVAIGNQIGQFLERQMAREALRRANDDLERRVAERTADLMKVNVQLERAMLERKRLEHELLEITEKERKRIGLDLHDDLGQRLSGLTLMTKGLEMALEKKGQPETADARKIHALMQQTMNHARGLARDMAFADLQDEDLPTALEELAANVKNLFDIPCHFNVEGDIPPLDRTAVMQFCKITQEAATNAVKHGKAAQILVDLVYENGRIVLTVRNNGLPFPSMIDQQRGMGLRIMNYRANVIGASLEVKPLRPKGTIVTCTLPIKATPTPNKGATEHACA